MFARANLWTQPNPSKPNSVLHAAWNTVDQMWLFSEYRSEAPAETWILTPFELRQPWVNEYPPLFSETLIEFATTFTSSLKLYIYIYKIYPVRWFPLAHHPQSYHTRAETKLKIQRRGMPWMQLRRRWATRLLLMGGGRSAQGAKWASSALVQGPLTFAVFAQARPNFVKSDLKKCYLYREALVLEHNEFSTS